MNNNNKYGMIINIVTGIQMALTIIMSLAIIAVSKNSETMSMLQSNIEAQGIDISSTGFTLEYLIGVMSIFFIIVAVFAILKFVFVLLGYLKNNDIFYLLSCIISIIFIITLIIMKLFIPVIIEAAILYLIFATFKIIRNNKMNYQQPITENKDQDKTVIDIEIE